MKNEWWGLPAQKLLFDVSDISIWPPTLKKDTHCPFPRKVAQTKTEIITNIHEISKVCFRIFPKKSAKRTDFAKLNCQLRVWQVPAS